MYLKSIKAYGFKSFADKTEINFGENINGIVGPNGSGKSNVVDAVRWVLGEQSLKALRGDNSSDVIFSGSKSRKPLNSASVTLIFDNSDNYLPINYNEVSIKRVMYRSGENEYYLNNERCRLKDITNILTDTGTDKESFNIISQGKIDEILSTKASDRRLVFESAAGVLKYKKRKEEAIKKIDRTNLNINRVNDILRELETNLLPLERQSKNAKEYLDLKKELSNLEISLITNDIYEYNYKSEELKKKIEELQDEIIDLTNNHTNYDITVLEKKDKIRDIETKITNNQNTLLEITKSIEKINSDIRVLKERKKYTQNGVEDENKIILLKEESLKKELIINECKKEIEKLNSDLNTYLLQSSTNENKLLELNNKKNKLNTEYEEYTRQINELKYKIDYIERTIQNNELYPTSIKNILNNNRLTGKHNTIGNLIEIDDEYRTAINISLGNAINYLVVDDKNSAREMVNYLKDNNLGRATFLPLDTIKPRYIDEETKIKIKNNNLVIASELVKYNNIYKNIIENQLGNIIITKDLDSANNISRIINNKYKIVTKDGQVVNVGGSITGGSIKENKNIIKEKYELEYNKLKIKDITNKQKEIETKLKDINKKINNIDEQKINTQNKIISTKEQINYKNNQLEEHNINIYNINNELKDLSAIYNNNTDKELEDMMNMYYSAIENRNNIKIELDKLLESKKNLDEEITEIEELSKKDQIYINNKEKSLKELEIKINTTNIKIDNLLLSLGEDYNLTYERAIEKYKLEIDDSIARTKVRELKDNIKDLGPINIEAIEEYDRVKSRYEFLSKQKEDLKNAENTLLEIVDEMDNIMKEKFKTTFEAIRKEFKKVFIDMFHGGQAELLLTDPNNLLETGIEIQAVPSGKSLKSISLLSGGEKTFTAISLLFAILNVRPVPFCLLDEVEAALDDANVDSFGNYLNKYRDKTQFILITHKKKTMEFADILYGITMQESGVSKLVSVKLEEIEKETTKL